MISMKRRTLVAAAATLASAATLRNSWADDAPGKPLPDLRFRLADGTERTLADYAGRGVVLNFWATWCVPCVAEMPSLDALAEKVGDRVVVLAASSDRGGAAAVQRFYTAQKVVHLPILLDPQGAGARAIGARGIPTTLLIDTKGRERARLEGPADWATEASVAMARALAV